MPTTNTPRNVDNLPTNRWLQSPLTRLGRAADDSRTVSGAEAQAAHVERLVCARTVENESAACTSSYQRGTGRAPARPTGITALRRQHRTPGTDRLARRRRRNPGGLTRAAQNAEMDSWLTAELERRVPDVVEAVLKKTHQRIVDVHSRTLVRSAIDDVVERGPF